MPPPPNHYRYLAVDPLGNPRRGVLDAVHADALVGEIHKRGWELQSFHPVSPTDDQPAPIDVFLESRPPGPRLNGAEAAELSGHLAEVVLAGMPLESGLAAIAEELPSRRLRRSLRLIVHRLERGMDLEQALADGGAPRYLRAVVEAGARTGTLGDALEQYAGTAESLRGTLPIVFGSLGYAALAGLLWLAICTFAVTYVLPSFAQMFEEFGLSLPWLTRATLSTAKFLRTHWLWIVLGLTAAPLTVLALVRIAAGRVASRRMLHSIPGIGTVVRSLAMCRFSVLLSLLVQSRVPLPDSLELAGEAAADAAISADARQLAALLRQGSFPTPAHWQGRSFSSGFVRALLGPTGHESVIQSLQSLAEVYSARVRYGLLLLAMVLPPILLIALGVATAIVVVAMYMPLIQLLNSLA